MRSVLFLLALAACNGQVAPSLEDPSALPGPTDDDTTDDTTDDGVLIEAEDCDPGANLEIIPMDIWGRDLPDAELVLGGTWQVVTDPDARPESLLTRIDGRDETVVLRIEAPEYVSTSVHLHVDEDGVSDMEATGGARLATTTDLRVLDGEGCPVHTVYVGLDHAWFAASGRAPSHNSADLLMSGETYWGAVATDVLAADERVTWATWWWQSDFELVRDRQVLGGPDRWQNTAMGMLQGLQGVRSRVLVTQFWGTNTELTTYLNGDDALYSAAESTSDNVEVMFQGNETDVPIWDIYRGPAPEFSFTERVRSHPVYAGRFSGQLPPPITAQAASWHQKTVVVDGEVAYVSGFNTKSTDWDTEAHEVFEPLRMEYGASTADREAVADKTQLPDLGPRKDYGIRVEGPAARDVEDILHIRWEEGRADEVLYAEHTTPFDLDPATSEVLPSDGGVHLQVVATMPGDDPEQSILETQLKAIAQATDYIYIEDQYYRAPRLASAVTHRMMEVPDLVLIAVNKPVDATDPGAHGSHVTHATWSQMFPERYLLLQLRTQDIMLEDGWFWDSYSLVSQDMDTHSKMRLIDDRYLSVGSCNWNNRGYLYEGELNVSVLDEGFATDARVRIFDQLAGEAAHLLTGDVREDIHLLRTLAEENQARLDWWTEHIESMDVDEVEARWPDEKPQGFVYPLTFADWYVLDAGPDAF